MDIWELNLFLWQILLICKVQLKYFSNGIFSFQPLNTKLLCPCCQQKLFALINNTDFHPSITDFLLTLILLKHFSWFMRCYNCSASALSQEHKGIISSAPNTVSAVSSNLHLPKWGTEQQSLLHFSVIPGTITSLHTSLLLYLIHSIACTSQEISDFSRAFCWEKPASRQGNLL